MKGRIRHFISGLLICVLIIIFAEVIFRLINQPDVEFGRFILTVRLNIERWSFLNRQKIYLQIKPVLNFPPDMDRVVEPETDRPPFDRIPVAYHLRTNNNGYRDMPFNKEKSAGIRRIFLLGDSTSFGKGVKEDQMFANILEKKLSELKETEIYNLAVPGCTTDCIAKILARFIDYNPDMIIFLVSSNDLDLELWRQGTSGTLCHLAFDIQKLLSHSRVFLYGSFLIKGDSYEKEIKRVLLDLEKPVAAGVNEILKLCRQKGIKLLMVSVPFSSGIDYSTPAEKACISAPEDCMKFLRIDLSHPEKWIPDWAEIVSRKDNSQDWVMQTGETLGLSPGILEKIFPYRHLFFDIVHPNEYGNIIIYEQLFDFLRKVYLNQYSNGCFAPFE
jgi:lysophospholipase L1-like esterase